MFSNVKPGDMVHYTTPQGQTGKGRAVLAYDTHVVVNRGKGQPKVVTDKNYIKHERGGKVVGALLSRIGKSPKNEGTEVSEELKVGDKVRLKKQWAGDAGKEVFTVHHKNADNQYWVGRGEGNAGWYVSHHQVTKIKEEAEQIDEISKETKDSYKEKALDTFTKRVDAVTNPNNPKSRRKLAIAAGGRFFKNRNARAIAKDNEGVRIGMGLTRATRLQGEDSRDVEAARQRIAKTKNKKKKKVLKELHNATLVNYIGKAIADRKARGAAELGRLRTNRPEYYANDNGANKKISKRSAGIKSALKKVASHLPSEPLAAHTASEKSKEGGWGMSEGAAKKAIRKGHDFSSASQFSVPVGNGYPKVRDYKDRLKAAGIPHRKVHSPYVGNIAFHIGDKHHKKASKVLYGEGTLYIAEILDEGFRNEYDANRAMAGSKPSAPGHYLMRDGRKISGPHTPEEAVRAYKNINTAGKGDSRGVKIHHVKEASEQKVKDAAQKAIKIAKDKKKGKTANTEPELKLPDGSTNSPSPVEANDGVSNHV